MGTKHEKQVARLRRDVRHLAQLRKDRDAAAAKAKYWTERAAALSQRARSASNSSLRWVCGEPLLVNEPVARKRFHVTMAVYEAGQRVREAEVDERNGGWSILCIERTANSFHGRKETRLDGAWPTRQGALNEAMVWVATGTL